MVNREQLISVAHSCSYYESQALFSSTMLRQRSCENCSNYDGSKCMIDVFDNVLASLDEW